MKSIAMTQLTQPIALPVVTGYEGTGLSVANRDRTTDLLTTVAAASAHSLLPTSDVDGAFGATVVRAGIRTWSPPV